MIGFSFSSSIEWLSLLSIIARLEKPSSSCNREPVREGSPGATALNAIQARQHPLGASSSIARQQRAQLRTAWQLSLLRAAHLQVDRQSEQREEQTASRALSIEANQPREHQEASSSTRNTYTSYSASTASYAGQETTTRSLRET